MAKQSILDPAEKWLAKQFLPPDEYYAFLKEPDLMRDKLKEKIFNDVRVLISKSNQYNPPFEPEKIMGYRKIKKIVWNENLTQREALLLPTQDGFYIHINPNKPNVRIRFSLAHEIGHTYFFDLNTSPPQKFYPAASSRTWVEEGYSCEIAREILMPEPYVYKIASKLSKAPSLSSLIQLKEIFQVSYEVLIMRLLHDAHVWNYNFWKNELWNCIIILAEVSPSAKINDLRIKIYRSPKFKYRLRRIKSDEKIMREIKDVLKNNTQVDKLIPVGRHVSRYRIQGLRHKARGVFVITEA